MSRVSIFILIFALQISACQKAYPPNRTSNVLSLCEGTVRNGLEKVGQPMTILICQLLTSYIAEIILNCFDAKCQLPNNSKPTYTYKQGLFNDLAQSQFVHGMTPVLLSTPTLHL